MSEVDIIIAVILGMFQGVTEWLPISSSGQTILAMVDVLNIDAKTALSMAFYLHFGTLMAVIAKLRGDVKQIIVRLPRFKEDKLVQFIVISTCATALVGIPVYIVLFRFFEEGIGGNVVTVLVGLFLVFTGVVLHILRKKIGIRALKDSNAKDSLIAGIGQGFAILPGVSRSGLTVAALVGKRFKQEDALRLSFLMSIPATIGIVILETLRGTVLSIGIVPIAAGIIASFIIGYLMIDVLLRFAKKVKFDVFCLVFGAIAIVVAVVVMV